MKRSIYVATANRQKLSNNLWWVDITDKKAVQKYLKMELKRFPEATRFKVHGIGNFLLISEWIE